MSGELFGVVARLAYRSTVHPSAPTAVITSQSGEGLYMEWDLQKTRTSSPDTATVRIFNLLPIHRADLALLSALPGRIKIELAIGWRGHGVEPTVNTLFLPTDVVFVGEDWRVVPEEREGPDIVTTIEAGDGIEVTNAAPQGGSEVALGMKLLVLLSLQQLGLKPSVGALAVIETEAAKITVSIERPTHEIPPRERLDLLMASMDLAWGISGGEFVIYRGGLRNDLPPAILTPQTGLLKWSVTDDGGVEFEALARPIVTPGAQATLLDELGQTLGGGPLRIETVRFLGTTEGPSMMMGVARKAVL